MTLLLRSTRFPARFLSRVNPQQVIVRFVQHILNLGEEGCLLDLKVYVLSEAPRGVMYHVRVDGLQEPYPHTEDQASYEEESATEGRATREHDDEDDDGEKEEEEDGKRYTI